MVKSKPPYTVAFVSVIFVFMFILSGCEGGRSDYASLPSGFTPRPEFETLLDLNMLVNATGYESIIGPEGMDILESLGFTSLQRNNLIAYERDGVVTVETSYSMRGTGGSFADGLLNIKPSENTMFGRMDTSSTLAWYHFSGSREYIGELPKCLSDPMVVKYYFGDNRISAGMAKQQVAMVIGMAEGSLMRFFKDEAIIALIDNPAFLKSHEGFPFWVVFIAPVEGDEPVSPKIADVFRSFGYLAKLIAPDMEGGLLDAFEPLKLGGYPGVFFSPDGEQGVGMVDVNGFFFAGSPEGVEAALKVFDTSPSGGIEGPKASKYIFVNFSKLDKSLLEPLANTAWGEDVIGSLGLPLSTNTIRGLLAGFSEQIKQGGGGTTGGAWAEFVLTTGEGGISFSLSMPEPLAAMSVRNLGVDIDETPQVTEGAEF